MNQLCLLLFVFTSIHMAGQDNRITIAGEIVNDSILIDNVHIINKSSNRGTLSDNKGKFKINVTDKDTLIFSNIQYKDKIITINQDHLLKKFIRINLEELTNELDEVIVMQYDNMAKELGLPNAGKKPLTKLERNLNHYSQKSTPIVILQALLFKPGGIDDIYNIVSGNRKKDRKLKKLLDEDKQIINDRVYVQKIREHFQDEFFLKTVKIEEGHINNYIFYCFPQGIVNLYNKGRLIEVIDIFLKSKDAYQTYTNEVPED